MRNLRIHTLFIAVVALIVAGAFSLALADQVVYFTNGKAIMVTKVEKGDDITILEIEGGGRIGVPTAQIVRIEEYAVSKPNTFRASGAQQSRTAARTPPPSAGRTAPQTSGTYAAPNAAATGPTNLIADAPSVVPGVQGGETKGLAAPRDVAQQPTAGDPETEAATTPPVPQVAGRTGGAASSAAALAAQQSMAAKMEQRQRGAAGRLNNPRGQNRPRGGLSGSVLMGGQPPRHPGQGAAQAGATVPANAREEEVIRAAPHRSRGKGGAGGKTPPPPDKKKDGEQEDPPSEAN